MRILVFHGYLLGGTGSNIYNARLAEAFVRLGHEVHLLCQDRRPDALDFVDAVGDWDAGALRVRERHETVRCTVYRPNIGSLLPVYVADRYEGIEARPFAECTDAEIARYNEANVSAVREVLERARPDVALANHLVMGPLILARALAGSGVPYAVKVHGSALEYTVKPNPERFAGPAREGLAGARGILVGSRHTALSLWHALEDSSVPPRTRLGPPGVDVERFVPRDAAAAAAAVRALAARLRDDASPGADEQDAPTGDDAPRSADGRETQDAFARDEAAAAAALERLDLEEDRLVTFVGKLIVSKGVDLLAAAWPLVLGHVPSARLVVVGFGAYRDGFERLVAALAAGDLDEARVIARAGRALEAAPKDGEASEGAANEGEAKPPDQLPLRHLLAFLDNLGEEEHEREAYLSAARGLPERIVLTGRLEHDELAELLPAVEAMVVPSTFPEAFGMVAVEAAACGALPVSAGHSGLAEVTRVLAAAVPPAAAHWLSFPVGAGAVPALADCVVGWLEADRELRRATREALVETVRERYSWAGVARTVVAAAQGELDGLPEPSPGPEAP